MLTFIFSPPINRIWLVYLLLAVGNVVGIYLGSYAPPICIWMHVFVYMYVCIYICIYIYACFVFENRIALPHFV